MEICLSDILEEELPLELKAVTFDFWNTLARDRDPVRVRQIAAEKMVKKLVQIGYHTDLERMVEAFALCRKVCYKCQEEFGVDFTPEEQVDWICRHLGVDAGIGTRTELLDYYTTSLIDIPPVLDDRLKDIFKRLKEKGYKLAIICNTGRTPGWVIRRILYRQEVLYYFDAVSFSNEMRIAKPNTRMFLITASKLDVAPGQILHVGDDIYTDVEGAHKAGFKAGWYNPGRLIKPGYYDIEITSLTELMDL